MNQVPLQVPKARPHATHADRMMAMANDKVPTLRFRV